MEGKKDQESAGPDQPVWQHSAPSFSLLLEREARVVKAFFTAAVDAVKENNTSHSDPTQQQGLATISDGIQCTHCILTPNIIHTLFLNSYTKSTLVPTLDLIGL